MSLNICHKKLVAKFLGVINDFWQEEGKQCKSSGAQVLDSVTAGTFKINDWGIWLKCTQTHAKVYSLIKV